MKKYIQYGCGLSCPEGWENFDASPTLVIQKLPLIGYLLKSRLNTFFPDKVKYGNIIFGLPKIESNTCDGIYCSHILEHLCFNDLRSALKNTFEYLKPSGTFRLIVPDLETHINIYIENKKNKDINAANKFIRYTLLGQENRRTGVKGVVDFLFSNHNHRWMWDFESLSNELKFVGFTNIKRCEFNDSQDEMFKLVEDKGRFIEYKESESKRVPALAIECKKQ